MVSKDIGNYCQTFFFDLLIKYGKIEMRMLKLRYLDIDLRQLTQGLNFGI